MDKKIEFNFVEYRGVEYPYRTIVIFGQTEINVAGESLSAAMGFAHTELGNEDAIHLDDEFACYAPDDLLSSGTDQELADWVESEIYCNEPTEPNTAMPFNWFSEHIDCVDDTDDDNADEYYYKQGNDGIRVYNWNREWVVTIKGRNLDEPEFHIHGISHWAFKPLVLLDATYAAMGEETHYSKEEC